MWSDDQIAPIRLPTGACHTIILCRPCLHRMEPGGVLYGPDSFLPIGQPRLTRNIDRALATCARLVDLAQAQPQLQVAVVGHASVEGSDDANQRLSQKRAMLIYAFLAHDPSIWESTTKGSLTGVDLAYLYVWTAERYGWHVEVATPESPSISQLASACRSFQSSYNDHFDESIDVDGECGPQTRAALFRVLDLEYRANLRSIGVARDNIHFFNGSPACGVGSHFVKEPIRQLDLANCAEGRFVDLIMIDPAELGTNESLPLAKIYTSEFVRRIVHSRNDSDGRLASIHIDPQISSKCRYTFCVGEMVNIGEIEAGACIVEKVPIDAISATLQIEDLETAECYSWNLDLKAIASVKTLVGVQQRLMNLGYYVGPVDGDMNDATRWSIRCFQEESGISVTGELDDTTTTALMKVHDD